MPLGLVTDLYQLTMAAGYFEAGKARDRATFELTVRRLPHDRNFILAAGLAQAVDYLLNFRITAEEIAYLRGIPQFRHASNAFFEMLADLRFTGDVFAVPEGSGSPQPSAVPVPLTYTGPGAAATTVSIAPETLTVLAGAPFAFTAVARDAQGATVAGAPVLPTVV